MSLPAKVWIYTGIERVKAEGIEEEMDFLKIVVETWGVQKEKFRKAAKE